MDKSSLMKLNVMLAHLEMDFKAKERESDVASLRKAREIVTREIRYARVMESENELAKEVINIMKDNHDDYCAEEYDPRFNYGNYNDYVCKVNDAREIYGFVPHEMWETKDFSEMCAIVARKLM